MKMQFPVKFVAVLVALLVISACAPMPLGGPGSENAPYIIKINFASANACAITGVTPDPTTCAKSGTGFCIGQSDWVQWESDPADIRYEVFFDPIQGRPFGSNGKGILKKKIDKDAPWVQYKYSILRRHCSKETDTFDPHIRVDR